MAAFVLIVVLVAVALLVVSLRRMLAGLPDSNEDFVFCGEAAYPSVHQPLKPKTVIPAEAGSMPRRLSEGASH